MITSHAGLVPLIGGQTIAAEQLLEAAPCQLMSFKPFAKNEERLVEYYPGTEYWLLDDIGPETDVMNLPKLDADMIMSTTPCAGMSGANQQAGVDYPSNCYLLKCIEYVLLNARPQAAVFEQAPVLWSDNSHTGLSMRAKINSMLPSDYSVTYVRTNAYQAGTPQWRQRTYVIFKREPRAVHKEVFMPNDPPEDGVWHYLRDHGERQPEQEQRIMNWAHQPDLQAIVKWASNRIDFMQTTAPRSRPMAKFLVQQGVVTGDTVHNDIGQLPEVGLGYLRDFKQDLLSRALPYEYEKPYGYGFCIMGWHSNVLYSASAKALWIPWENRTICPWEVATLMGLPKFFHSVDNVKILTQNVCVPITKLILENYVL